MLFLLALCMSSQIMAQQDKLTGVVTDANDGSPLIGVSVMIKGGSQGSITDVDGKYSLDIANKNAILIFSYVGYIQQEINVKPNQKVLDVVLEDDTKLLNEIVVIGYGAVKKSDLTGAVGSLKSEDLMKTNPTSLNQGLQGRIAGVQVNQNDGAPGAGVSIQIRGANSTETSTEPLYIIDGIPFTSSGMPGTGRDGMMQTTNPLGAISPSDIESIEVLKDASATAIYGSRGANGVVLVTTRKGTKGKDNITFNSNFGVSKVVKQIDMLDGYGYAKYRNEAAELFNYYENGNTPTPYPGTSKIDPDTGEEVYSPGPEDYLSGKYPSVKWQDKVFETAITQEYNLSVSGANDKGHYFISGNILDQEGVIKNSDYKRYAFRSNVSRKVHDWIELGTSMSFTNSTNKLAKTNSTSDGIVRGALFYPATAPLDEETSNSQLNWYSSNPFVYTRAAKDDMTSNMFFSSSFVEITPFEDLKVRQNVGYSYNQNERSVYYNSETAEGKDPTNGYASKADNWSKNLALESMATYNKVFNPDHSLNVVGVFAYEKGDYGSKSMTATGFPQDITQDYDISAGINQGKPQSGKGMTSLVSFLGRANYNLKSKYLFTTSYRRDGASKFAPGNKWSDFLSGAIAWRASEEEFIKNLNVFSNLKVRVSYGQTGNQGIGAYSTRDRLMVTNYPINGNLTSGYGSVVWAGPGNPKLKWETTDQYNAGIDIGILNNKINLTVDVYHKKTKDLLQQINIPGSTGFERMLTNFGSITNKGLEITGSFYPITMKKFSWDFNANISFNKNKMGDLPSDKFATTSWNAADKAFLQRNGLPLGTIFGYVEDGFYDNIAEVKADPFYADKSDAICLAKVGEVKYKDFDGKPGITSGDRQVIGDTNPDFVYGMTHNFKYENITLSFFLQGSVGGDVLNANLLEVTMSGIGNIPNDIYNSRWQPDNNVNAKWPKAYAGYGRTMLLSDRYIESGTYLRLKNLSIGYTFNSPFKGVESIHLSGSVSNLFTISNYSWFDPDVNSFGSNAALRGVDLFSYPSSRTFTFGLQCVF